MRPWSCPCCGTDCSQPASLIATGRRGLYKYEPALARILCYQRVVPARSADLCAHSVDALGYIYIYMYVCVCVCGTIERRRRRRKDVVKNRYIYIYV